MANDRDDASFLTIIRKLAVYLFFLAGGFLAGLWLTGSYIELELTRFRGHFALLEMREVHDVPQSSRVSAGIPAEAD
jgi:hypothetical protein